MKKLYLLLSLLFSFCTNVYAQWDTCLIKSQSFFYTIAACNNSIYAGSYGEGLFISSDNGNSWIQNYLLEKTVILSFAVDGNSIYIGVKGNGLWIYLSDSNRWIQRETVYDVNAIAISSNTIFAGTVVGGVIISTDNGINWIQKDFGFTDYSIIKSFAISSNTIFAGTSQSAVFISTNNGNSWSQTNLKNLEIWSMILYDNKLFVGSFGKGLFSSSDNGYSWTAKNNGLKSDDNIYSLATSDKYMFLGTQRGIFISSDKGESWIEKNNELTKINILGFAITNDYIFAASGVGYGYIFKAKISEITDVEDKDENHDIKLFPNPANDYITFNLNDNFPNSSINIFNDMGIEVYNNNLYTTSININTKSFLPGIYFCVVKLGNRIETHKFVVIR